MRAAGIGVQVHYVPIYRHPLFAPFGAAPSDFPETERGVRRAALAPDVPVAHRRQQDRVVTTLASALA